ncbi:MAG: hypothetical protein LBR29_08325, partial [Methylobacteriaceae bacterium]|nr:hypothetical protein [Methylobacteriaceae bacterium]
MTDENTNHPNQTETTPTNETTATSATNAGTGSHQSIHPQKQRHSRLFGTVAVCALLAVGGVVVMRYSGSELSNTFYYVGANMSSNRGLGYAPSYSSETRSSHTAPSARSAPAMSAPQPAARQWERIEMAELAPARETAREMA